MDIGEAIEEMRAGGRVRRAGWNGKGMWLALIKEGWSAFHNEAAVVPEHTLPFVLIFTADKKFIPWLCSQADLLAKDWELA